MMAVNTPTGTMTVTDTYSPHNNRCQGCGATFPFNLDNLNDGFLGTASYRCGRCGTITPVINSSGGVAI